MFRENEIVILLGAGASVEAGIPHSTAMIEEVEDLVKNDSGWDDFQELYYYVRSAIHYAEGIKGRIGRDVSYNIERLAGTLDEIAKRDEHTLYPFVGAWNPKLTEVAGPNFEKVQGLKDKIVGILRDEWVPHQHYEDLNYYEGLICFQQQLNFPLRVFTLNYDLCVEKAYEKLRQKYPERGFENRKWNWRLFEDNPGSPKDLFLYKVHGSIDWERKKTGELTYVDSPSRIRPDDIAIIFGATYKLQSVDPFLFLAYEFRKWTLESKLIITIGYWFADEHINGILGQALDNSVERKLLSVTPYYQDDATDTEHERRTKQEQETERIEEILRLKQKSQGQVLCWNHGAKDFTENQLRIDQLSALFPEEPTLFDEAGMSKESPEKEESS